LGTTALEESLPGRLPPTGTTVNIFGVHQDGAINIEQKTMVQDDFGAR
jgi:hypothetical protein